MGGEGVIDRTTGNFSHQQRQRQRRPRGKAQGQEHCSSHKRLPAPTRPRETPSVITHPVPVPIPLATYEDLLPLLSYLSQTPPNPPPVTTLNFPRGTLFADGRLDLCKQAVGPSNIGALCQAIQRGGKHGVVAHVLLGNNIVCDDDNGNGARALASLMKDEDLLVETWYLAGNCCNTADVRLICDALKENGIAKALWLKRNRLGSEGAALVGGLLTVNKTLEVLDMNNTALFDTGVEALLSPSMLPGERCHVRHWYFDANGITEKGAETIASFLSDQERHQVRSIYIALNPLSDRGVHAILGSLSNSPWVKRLNFASCALSDRGVPRLVDLCLTMPNLAFLDLGEYKSAQDMGVQENTISTASISALCRLLAVHPRLQCLSIMGAKNRISKEGYMRMRQVAAAKEIGFIIRAESQLGFSAFPANQKLEVLRDLTQPHRVKDIESIYRGA